MNEISYETLGIAPGATKEEIRRAYQEKMKVCHPDMHPHDSAAVQQAEELNAAYNALMNPIISSPLTHKENHPETIAERRFFGRDDSDYSCKQTGEWSDNNGNEFIDEAAEKKRFYAQPQILPDDDAELKKAIYAFERWDHPHTMNILLNMKGYQRNARWYYVLACTYRELQKTDKAERAIKKATELDPDNEIYRHLLNRYRIELKNGTYYQYKRKPSKWLIVLAVAAIMLLIAAVSAVVQGVIGR